LSILNCFFYVKIVGGAESVCPVQKRFKQSECLLTLFNSYNIAVIWSLHHWQPW